MGLFQAPLVGAEARDGHQEVEGAAELVELA
jgi:hypothetical protein